LTAAYTGLRGGEMRALRVKRLDLERGRIDVAEAMPERAIELDTPKNHKRRTVPVPGSLSMSLRSTSRGRGLMNSSSPTQPGMLHNTNFRRDVFNQAARSIGLQRLHTSRHSPYDWLHWRSARERTSRLCSGCSDMRQRR
jgi:integrase